MLTDDEIDALPPAERYAARGERAKRRAAQARVASELADRTPQHIRDGVLDLLPFGLVRMLPSQGLDAAPCLFPCAEWPRDTYA